MAKRKAKKQTPYQHEVELLKSRIKSAEKKGYSFDDFKIPRSTKQVHQIRRKVLYEMASSYNPPEQSKQEEAPHDENLILDNLYILLAKLENSDTSYAYGSKGYYNRPKEMQAEAESARTSLLELLQDEVNETSPLTVAKRIESVANSGELDSLVEQVLHAPYREEIRSAYQRLANIIKGSMLSATETKYWGDRDSETEEMNE